MDCDIKTFLEYVDCEKISVYFRKDNGKCFKLFEGYVDTLKASTRISRIENEDDVYYYLDDLCIDSIGVERGSDYLYITVEFL